MEMVPVYRRLALALDAYRNCVRKGDGEWAERHLENIQEAIQDYLPHGSGFDATPEIDVDACREDRLVFLGSFHEMNSVGYYTRWVSFRVIVSPSFIGEIDVRVRSSDRLPADLRELIADAYYAALVQRVPRYSYVD